MSASSGTLPDPLPSTAPAAPSATGTFQCPGERSPISLAVHLSRMAAGHPACRDCVHRKETGLLPGPVVRQIESRLRSPHVALRYDDGVRAPWQNLLTREQTTLLVQHALDMVDDSLTARRQRQTGAIRAVLAYDERPSAPDLALGAMSALRRCGCDIADLGCVSRPEFDFGVHHLSPDVGIFITGGNAPAGWSGLDLVDADGHDWEPSQRLETLVRRLESRPSRASRQAGQSQFLDFHRAYQDALARQFHALRPLRVGMLCRSPRVRNTLRQLFDETPCHVQFLSAGAERQLTLAARQHSTSELFYERRTDVAFIIPGDARDCRVFDESGQELAVDDVLALLSVLSDGDAGFVRTDRPGRFRFAGEVPACDAILTISRVLEALSHSPRDVSDYRQRCSQSGA